jgi:hypothetical protein
MATRMQQRRGTAAQWTAANPVLAAGEIGFETDTNKFKMGNGTSAWTALIYFANAAELAAIIDGAPLALDTLNELAAALGDNANFLTSLATNARVDEIVLSGQAVTTNAITKAETELSTHAADTTSVHGILNTADLATKTYAEGAADAAVDTAIAALTKSSVGLSNVDDTQDAFKPVSAAQATAIATAKTEAIAAAGQAADTKVSDHNTDETNVHGIPDTSVLVTQTELTNAIAGVTVDQSELAGTGLLWDGVNEKFTIDTTVATKTYADGAVSTHEADSTSVHGISDTSQLAYKNAANQTFTGNMEVEGNIVVEGNLTISGTTTTVNAADLSIQDPLIYLASNQYTQDTLDVGFLAATGAPGGTEESHLHSGFFRDASDSKKWKLVSNVPHPVNNVVDVTNATRETLVVGALEATTVTPSSGIVFSDGTQTKVGVPSITTFATAISSSATLAAGEADKFVPLTGAVTITLPATGYSTGQSIDFYQASGTGASFASTNNVVGTPGLKFRTTNSVVTAMKTSGGWLIFGDLSA